MNIEKSVNDLRKKVMDDKNFFWNHPENGFEEYKTSEYIIKRLKEIGFSNIKTGIAKTGVVATLKGKSDFPCVLLRADMDAVQMDLEGRMKHTCGHDAHMAILLAVSKLLFDTKENIQGTVKILFQPAEESTGGAKPMIEEGVLENPKVDKVFALHVWSEIPHGKIGIKEGAIMASTDPFVIEIEGKGGHAALPEKCSNPIIAGSKIVEGFKNIDKKYNKEEKNIVLGITSFHGGSTTNVIPDNVKMKGIFRTYSNEIRNTLKKEIQYLIKNIEEETKTKIKLTHIEERPVVVNTKEDVEKIKELASQIVGNENVVTDYKTMCSEDFSFFLEKATGAFVFIGCMQDVYYPQHNENFVVDEESVMLGVQMLYNIAKEYLIK